MAGTPDKGQIKQAIEADPPRFYGQLLPDLKPDGARWKACCPLHHEQDPSFTVYPDGAWNCFGCHQSGDGLKLLMEFHNLDFPQALAEAGNMLGVTVESSKPGGRKQLEATYQVLEADGTLVAEHLRFRHQDGGKSFAWRRDGKSGLGNYGQRNLPLYRLPELTEAPASAVVIMAEGEKATDALRDARQVAVGTYGSGVLPTDERLQPLVDRIVVLWPDADADPEKGLRHMRQIGARLQALGGQPRLFAWADAPEGGDAFDFLQTHTPEELAALLVGADVPEDLTGTVETDAPATEPEPRRDIVNVRARTAREVLDSCAATSWLWPNYVVNDHLNLTAAPGDSGKSYSELAIIKTITTGCDWPDGLAYDREPGNCLWLDFEGMDVATCERARGMGIPLDRLFLPPQGVLPYLTKRGAFDVIRSLLEQTGAVYVVCDSWRRATPGLTESDSDGTGEIGDAIEAVCRDFGIPFKVIAHTRKIRQKNRTGNTWEVTLDDVRGTSALADMARIVTVIEKPSATSDTRRFRVEKSNLGGKPETLGFDLAAQADGTCEVVWTDAPFAGRDMPKTTAAEEAIQIALQGGAKRNSEIAAALKGRISERTMNRALPNVAAKLPDGRWGLKA
ncbi:MAG: AAA family ATPase [Armatimonadetes bacterium]|nr:AAA family ATPase [Armatimonadota bacterium]